MRALITASFAPAARERLERLMDVVHEDWKERGAIHLDGAEFAAHIRDVGADVLIVEADLVHAEVMNACPLGMIGCCRGDPVSVDLALATAKGIPVFHAPGRNADAVADLAVAFMLMLARRLPAIREAFGGGKARLDSAADFLAVYTGLTRFDLAERTVRLVCLRALGRGGARRLLAFPRGVLAAPPRP